MHIDRIKPCLVRTTQQADEVDVQSIGVGELSNALEMMPTCSALSAWLFRSVALYTRGKCRPGYTYVIKYD